MNASENAYTGRPRVSRKAVMTFTTSDFVAELPLSRGDVVYISPLVEYRDSPYYDTVTKERLGILSAPEKLAQAQILKDRILSLWKERNSSPPNFPVAPYLLAESIY